jgi:hypothetical protein
MKHTCFICKEDKHETEGGWCTVGELLAPLMRWICNLCLLGKVCP